MAKHNDHWPGATLESCCSSVIAGHASYRCSRPPKHSGDCEWMFPGGTAYLPLAPAPLKVGDVDPTNGASSPFAPMCYASNVGGSPHCCTRTAGHSPPHVAHAVTGTIFAIEPGYEYTPEAVPILDYAKPVPPDNQTHFVSVGGTSPCGNGSGHRTASYGWDRVTCPECLKHKPALSTDPINVAVKLSGKTLQQTTDELAKHIGERMKDYRFPLPPIVDRAYRFFAGLQLSTHPISVQREAREILHQLGKALGNVK